MKTKYKIIPLLTGIIFNVSVVNAVDLNDILGNKNQTAIQYLHDNQVIAGYPDGSFKPNNPVKRGELLKILVGGKKISPPVNEYKNCFIDVNEEWFAPFVCYAKAQGWVAGYEDGTFKPEQNVKKSEAIKMLINSQGYEPSTEKTVLFDDIEENAWYTPFIKTAKEKSLLEIINGSYGISNEITRAEISENLYRAMIINANQLTNFSEYDPSIKPTSLSKNNTESYQVTNVVDGDTIDVNINGEIKRVRFIGVETPESKDTSKPVECFSAEATKITTEKLLNKKVHLEVDNTQPDIDKYERLLRYVILEDNTNFNLWLIQNGYGFEYTYNHPYKYQEDFINAEKNASEKNVGLWAEESCGGELTPVDTTEENEDNINTSSYSFYVSKIAKTKYYCETDSAWKNLAPQNLLKYETEEELKTDFPKLTLNKPC